VQLFAHRSSGLGYGCSLSGDRSLLAICGVRRSSEGVDFDLCLTSLYASRSPTSARIETSILSMLIVEMGGTMKIAVLQGDPMTAGRSYTLRLSCTDGTKIAPHWHPATENVTVIKGSFLLGMGAKWDDSTMKEIPVGGFASASPQMRHYAQCKGDTVVQVNGIAPFVVNFVGPDDTGPSKK